MAIASGRPAEGQRLPYLDGYRALAALSVLVYHVTTFRGWVPDMDAWGADAAAWVDHLGNYGVCVFFLLSGLVLYRPFAAFALRVEERPDLVAYASRRVLRIYPAYVIALTAWYAFAFFPLAGHVSPGTYVAEYLLVQNYVTGGLEASLPIAWTLCVEVGFYLALPLLAFGIRHLPGGSSDHPADRLTAQVAGVVILTLVSFGFRWYVTAVDPSWPGNPQLWLPNYFDWFALGMLLAVLHSWCAAGRPLPRAVGAVAAHPLACWTVALAAYWWLVLIPKPGSPELGPGDEILRFSVSGVSAWFVLLPAVLPGPRRRVLSLLDGRPLLYLGSISYGLYLWHTMVIRWAFDRPLTFSTWQLLLFTLGITIAVSAASFAFVERQVQHLGRPGARTLAIPVHLRATAPST
jgi:peptidoglycan/LPS O-acetylase OafA/YrhL